MMQWQSIESKMFTAEAYDADSGVLYPKRMTIPCYRADAAQRAGVNFGSSAVEPRVHSVEGSDESVLPNA